MHHPRTRSVAVIGAGGAGLAAAWFLHRAGLEVQVFERRRAAGGNMRTRLVELEGTPRWVDLGVSDFNRGTYHELVALLDTLGVPYRPISNTTTLFDRHGRVCYTLGRRTGSPPPPEVQEALRRFRQEACEVLDEPSYHGLTVDEYLREKHYAPGFARDYLLPRIQGMWFCHERGPGSMPMRAVMEFCALQEGLVRGEAPRPERMHFTGGASSLAEALRRSLPEGTVRTGVEAQVVLGEQPAVYTGVACLGHFDAVVFAVHADEVSGCVRGPLPEPLARVLPRFRYSEATVYAHTWTGLLPPSPRAWGAFNVRVDDEPRAARPYTMTCVANLHQDDEGNPSLEGRSQPAYFFTANPVEPIPEPHLLRDVWGAPVVERFRHNIADGAALRAQEELRALQGLGGCYFAGGYTRGVGLMEHCVASGRLAAEQVLAATPYEAVRVASARSRTASRRRAAGSAPH